MTPARIALLVLFALPACGASTDPELDAGPLDGASGPIDCAAREGASGELECDEGCVVIRGIPLDEEGQCRLPAQTIIACHPPDAMVSSSGDLACLEREGAPNRVWSSSGSSVWTTPGGPTVLLFDEAGWTRCDPLEGWELGAPACDL